MLRLLHSTARQQAALLRRTATGRRQLATAAGENGKEAPPKFHEGPILFGIIFGLALAFNYVMVQQWAPSLHKEELEKRIHITDPNAGPAHLVAPSKKRSSQVNSTSNHPDANPKAKGHMAGAGSCETC